MAVRRVVVVGPSESGTTHLARRLAAELAVPLVELDDLHWQAGPPPRRRPDFDERVAAATAGDAWVAEGAYETPAVLAAWHRAQVLVWLAEPAVLVALRFVARELRFGPRGRRSPREWLRHLAWIVRKVRQTLRMARDLGRRRRATTPSLQAAGVHVALFRRRVPDRWLP